MNRYYIKVELDNGDMVEARAVGNNESDALRYLQSQKQYKEFVNNCKVVNLTITEIESEEKANNYVVAISANKRGLVVTDIDNNIVCRFDYCKFNANNKVTALNDTNNSAVDDATHNRQLADYVKDNLLPFAQICTAEELREFMSKKIISMRTARNWSRYKVSARSFELFGEKQGLTATQVKDIEDNRYIPRYDTLYKLIITLLVTDDKEVKKQ